MRVERLCFPLVALGSLLLMLPVRANAATVAIRVDATSRDRDEIHYVADTGERNDVVLAFDRDRKWGFGTIGVIGAWTVNDAGAVISAGEGCVPIDEHTVTCPPRSSREGGRKRPLEGARVELADSDDRLASAATWDSPQAVRADGGPGDDDLDARESGSVAVDDDGVELEGGSGNDRLVGGAGFDSLSGGTGDDVVFGGAGWDGLDGGGGRDMLFGQGGGDIVADGDRDEGVGELTPGPDVLSGGGGYGDTVDYSTRISPLSIDLADDAPDGEAGEGDELSGFEEVKGGRGDDRLAGDHQANWLFGNGGRDRLIGRHGNDRLAPGTGGGPIVCGAGSDLIQVRSWRDFLHPDCETVVKPRRLALPAQPTLSGRRSLRYRAQCPWTQDPDAWESHIICAGTLRMVRAAEPHRLLAHGTIRRGRGPRNVNVKLTALGRRLATRRNGVEAIVRIRGSRLPRMTWSIRLRLRN